MKVLQFLAGVRRSKYTNCRQLEYKVFIQVLICFEYPGTLLWLSRNKQGQVLSCATKQTEIIKVLV